MELFHDTLFLSPSCGVYWHCLKPFLGCCIPYHPCTPYHVTKATCILRSVAQIETLKFTKIRLATLTTIAVTGGQFTIS